MSEIEKDLAELLREHRGGVVLRDASRQFGELIDAVLELDMAGSLTIKIGVKPVDEGESVSVKVDVASSPPRPPAGSSTFYVRHGTLAPFEDPPADGPPEAVLAAMAVHAPSDEEDRRAARATS